jgi:hypothetical protein
VLSGEIPSLDQIMFFTCNRSDYEIFEKALKDQPTVRQAATMPGQIFIDEDEEAKTGVVAPQSKRALRVPVPADLVHRKGGSVSPYKLFITDELNAITSHTREAQNNEDEVISYTYYWTKEEWSTMSRLFMISYKRASKFAEDDRSRGYPFIILLMNMVLAQVLLEKYEPEDDNDLDRGDYDNMARMIRDMKESSPQEFHLIITKLSKMIQRPGTYEIELYVTDPDVEAGQTVDDPAADVVLHYTLLFTQKKSAVNQRKR